MPARAVSESANHSSRTNAAAARPFMKIIRCNSSFRRCFAVLVGALFTTPGHDRSGNNVNTSTIGDDYELDYPCCYRPAFRFRNHHVYRQPLIREAGSLASCLAAHENFLKKDDLPVVFFYPIYYQSNIENKASTEGAVNTASVHKSRVCSSAHDSWSFAQRGNSPKRTTSNRASN